MTSLAARQKYIALVSQAVAAGARQSKACQIVGISARCLQRWTLDDEGDGRPARMQDPSNRLTDIERQRVLRCVNSPEFKHLPPSQIVPILADRGTYICSERTMYRVMEAAGQNKRRDTTRRAGQTRKPRALTATAPNQIYSWDITYLPTSVRGVHYYLYMFLDIFSRKIVGWSVYGSESSEHASDVLRDACMREKIQPGQVVLHSDNGAPMKGSSMLATLQALGVTPSFSRPAVSNDNPYSESAFKTLKYRPTYPQRAFADLQAARAWVAGFVNWYNNEHRHSAIRFVTPSQRHAGLDPGLLRRRQAIYSAACQQNPHRWTKGLRNWEPIRQVHLNPQNSAAANGQKHMRAA